MTPPKITTGAQQVIEAAGGAEAMRNSQDLRPLRNQSHTGARPLLDDPAWVENGTSPTVYVHDAEDNWVKVGDAAARLIASVIKAQEVKE